MPPLGRSSAQPQSDSPTEGQKSSPRWLETTEMRTWLIPSSKNVPGTGWKPLDTFQTHQHPATRPEELETTPCYRLRQILEESWFLFPCWNSLISSITLETLKMKQTSVFQQHPFFIKDPSGDTVIKEISVSWLWAAFFSGRKKKIPLFQGFWNIFQVFRRQRSALGYFLIIQGPCYSSAGEGCGRCVSLQKCHILPLKSSLLFTPRSPVSQFFILAFWWNKNVWVTLRWFAAYPSFSLLVKKPFLPIKTSLNTPTLKIWLSLSQLIRGTTPTTRWRLQDPGSCRQSLVRHSNLG